MVPIIDSVVGTVVSQLWDPTARHIGYLLNAGSRIKKLDEAIEQLKLTHSEVKQKIEDCAAKSEEHEEAQEPTERVLQWLTEFERVELKVQNIKDDYIQRKKLFGGCLLNSWSACMIGRRADKKIKEVKELDEKAKFEQVIKKKPIPKIRRMLSTAKSTPALDHYVNQVLEYLASDGVSRVGVWGMGGVGKTTLLRRINNDPRITNAGFDFVIWAVVSRPLDVKKLQKDIADRLRLTLTFEEPELSARFIYDLLKNKKFLLLLDDLWEHLDILKLGVPCDRQGKVVFTTRSKRICAEMHASKMIRVECLTWEEAWVLFRNNIGQDAKSIIDRDERARSRAERVAEMCGGLPLALIVVGRAMSPKETWREWQDTIDLMTKWRLPEMWSRNEGPFPLLKISYDHLRDDTTRRCFLCCSLWPEDFPIAPDELIRLWMGLGLIDDFDDLDEVYNRGHAIVQELKRASLLETADDLIGRVRMHDVIRGLALWIASDCGANTKNWVVHAGERLTGIPAAEKWREAEAVSLMCTSIHSLRPLAYSCPRLSLLLLQEGSLTNIPDGFFQHLPALTYLDISWCFFEVLPKDIAVLVNLQYLDLTYSRILALPAELGGLAQLRYLILRGTGKLRNIPHGLITRLQKLLVLDLSGSGYAEWDAEGQASMEELDRSGDARLKAVGITSSTVPMLVKLFASSGIPTRWLYIKKLRGVTSLSLPGIQLQSANAPRIERLTIMECDSLENLTIGCSNSGMALRVLLDLLPLMERVVWSRDALRNIRSLTINSCDSLKTATWISQLPLLELLELTYCSQLERVIDGTGESTDVAEAVSKISQEAGSQPAFSMLTTLCLRRLPLLQAICSPRMTFPCLEYVNISQCPKLTRLPLPSQMASDSLRMIEITGSKTWWEALEWDEVGDEASLLPYFREVDLPSLSD